MAQYNHVVGPRGDAKTVSVTGEPRTEKKSLYTEERAQRYEGIGKLMGVIF